MTNYHSLGKCLPLRSNCVRITARLPPERSAFIHGHRMRASKKNNKPRGQHWTLEEFPAVPDWETAHIFLEVARCGSFRAAAQKLRQSVNALRRKVDALEQDLGVPL